MLAQSSYSLFNQFMNLRILFNGIDRQLRPWSHFKKIESKKGTQIKKDGIVIFSPEAEKLIDRYARNLVIFIIFSLLVLLLINYILYKIFFPDFGRNINIGFYEALAQILPVLLIALFLAETPEIKSNSAQRIERLNRSVWQRLTINDDRLLGLITFIPAELACLIAIARDSTGTGLFLLSLFGAGPLALLLIKRISNRL
jgi:hypothetical protein